MTSRDFCYWLQGFFEINEAEDGKTPYPISQAQAECIKKHLNMVFIHEIDPSFPKEQQADLNEAHGNVIPAGTAMVVNPVTGVTSPIKPIPEGVTMRC